MVISWTNLKWMVACLLCLGIWMLVLGCNSSDGDSEDADASSDTASDSESGGAVGDSDVSTESDTDAVDSDTALNDTDSLDTDSLDTDSLDTDSLDTASNPMIGFWVSRSPGPYFNYDVLEFADNGQLVESYSSLDYVEGYRAAVDALDPNAGQFVLRDASDGAMDWYVSYSQSESPMNLYFSDADFVAASGGSEGEEYFRYYRADPSECRKYVAQADLEIDGETGTATCGFSADMMAHYCTFAAGDEPWEVTQGYDGFESFLNESMLPGKISYLFEAHPGGNAVNTYDAAGRLTGTSVESGRVVTTFSRWDSDGRPLAGSMTFDGYDCTATVVIRAYDDQARTVTETLLFADATGTDCPEASRTVVEGFSETGFLISRREYDGDTLTSEATTSNPSFAHACAFEVCPDAVALPPSLSQVYEVSVAGDWTGTAALTFDNGSVALSDVDLHMTSGSYQFTHSGAWDAACIKEAGDMTLFLFEKKIQTTPPGGPIQQVIFLALPSASLGEASLSGSYEHGSWISGSNSGTVNLVAL